MQTGQIRLRLYFIYIIVVIPLSSRLTDLFPLNNQGRQTLAMSLCRTRIKIRETLAIPLIECEITQ